MSDYNLEFKIKGFNRDYVPTPSKNSDSDYDTILIECD